MREFLVEDKLKKDIQKLLKRDRVLYSVLMSKVEEIITCSDVNHYRNLKFLLQHLKRVHVRGAIRANV